MASFRKRLKALRVRSAVLISLLLHLLLLRVLVADSAVPLDPPKTYDELPILIDRIERGEGAIELELLTVTQMKEGVVAPIEMEVLSGKPAAERDAASRGAPVFGEPIREEELPSLATMPGAAWFIGPVGIFEPDMPPLRLNDRRWEGEVKVGIYVDPQGLPERVWLIEGSGRREADDDALDYFRHALWRPAEVDGEPVGWVLERTVVYRQQRIFW